MKQSNNLKNIYYVFLTMCLLILPDVLFALFNDGYNPFLGLRGYVEIAIISIGLILNKHLRIVYFFIALCFVLQLIQFSHIAYFGSHLAPHSFYMLTHEIGDIFQESTNMFMRYWYILPCVAIPFAFLFLLVKKHKRKNMFGPLFMIISICQIIHISSPKNDPVETAERRLTLTNSLRSLVYYLRNQTASTSTDKIYEPYVITKEALQDDEEITIVYILGESASYKHMSLYGYDRETTPRLAELSNAPNFYYTKGISGAVSTFSATKFAMNVIREVDNTKAFLDKNLNLFKLAKQNGFKTYYLSSQSSRLMACVNGIEYIDVKTSKPKYWSKESGSKDEHLIELVKTQNFGKRNFIVLHQTCIHAPYNKTFGSNATDHKKFSGSKEPLIDDYDNAMFYNDYLISTMFSLFNQIKSGKFYIFFASDHNEALWEEGHFGHAQLYKDIADIPVMLQTNDLDFLEKFKQINTPNHYEIGKSIASLMGYKIENPNEKDDIFYVCGVESNGRAGYLTYQKNQDGVRFITE